jgi:hypothetical protein
VEVAQEAYKLLFVFTQDFKDRLGLVGVGYEDFEHVERLKLYASALIPQEYHQQFQIVLI